MMQLIDTHAHLQWHTFDDDRDRVIARAEEAGVIAILTLATDLQTSHEVIRLAEKYPIVYAGVGIHPTDAAKADWAHLQDIARLAQHPKVVAIGETGMDFYWDKTTGAIQEKFFLAQLKMSAELDLPVVIHNREAGQAILDVLAKVPDLCCKGVFHCFGERENYAQTVFDCGFHISFTGNLTYKKSTLPEISKAVPLERLLLETDSPFMAPVPKRGKRNEPAFVKFIAEKHAAIRELSVDVVCEATTTNALALFGIPR